MWTRRGSLLWPWVALLLLAPREGRAADRPGDPLPPGAVARLGTVRFRGDGWVRTMCYAPDGKTLASSGSRTIYLWDAVTGKRQRQFVGDKYWVHCLAFAPDGKYLASGGNDNLIRLWDPAAGKEVRQFHGHHNDPKTTVSGINTLAFSPDGKTLVSAGRDQTVRLWDVASGKELRRYKGHSSEVCSLVLSPDGRLLAAHYGGEGNIGFVKLWEFRTARELPQLNHLCWLNSLAFSPDSKLLASAGGKKHRGTPVVLWDVATGKEVRSFGGGQHGTSAVAFSADGKTLVSGGWDKTVRLWDVATGKEKRRLKDYPLPVKQVLLSPDGKHVAAGFFAQAVEVRDLDGETASAAGHVGGVNRLVFSADGKLLATGSYGLIHVWDVAARKQLHRIDADVNACSHLDFLPDSKTLLTTGLNGKITLWDATSGRQRRTLQGEGASQSSAIFAAALSPDGKRLAGAVEHLMGFAPSRRQLVLWDTATGKIIRGLRFPPRLTTGVLFGPDSRTLAAVGLDPEARLRTWDASTGRPILLLGKGPSPIEGAAFSPDGKLLAGSRWDGQAHLWEAATGLERLTLKSKDPVTAVVFSPDGTVLATINDGHTRGYPPVREEDVNSVRFWDAFTGKELRRVTGHRDAISVLAFSPDGKYLATGSSDTSVLLWDVPGILRRPRGEIKELRQEELKALAADLAGKDGGKVHRAVRALAADPVRSVPFLGRRLRPAVAVDPKVTARLIADLGGNRFAVREKAAQELEQLAEAAHPALRAVLAGSPALEVRRRVERLLEHPCALPVPVLRSLEILEHAGTPEARDLLRRLADGLPDASLTKEARASLARLSRRSAR